MRELLIDLENPDPEALVANPAKARKGNEPAHAFKRSGLPVVELREALKLSVR